MIKLSLRMLMARFKWLLIIVVSLGITIAVMVSLMTSSEAIKSTLKDKAYASYGEHTGVLLDVKSSTGLLEKEKFDSGEYQLIDTFEIKNGLVATIGWMDNLAIELGHINLLEGKYPIKENEVAIEAFYLEKIDPTWEIGDKRKLPIKGKRVNVELVGIIEDYSAKWTVPYNVEKGKNDYPNIFVTNNYGSIENTTSNLLIKFHNEKNESGMVNLIDTYNNEGFINDNLLFKGLKQYDNITNLTNAFLIIIFAASSFCFFGLFYYFNLSQLKKDAQMKALGCNDLRLYMIHVIQCVIIFFLSVVFSVPLLSVFHRLIIKNTFLEGEFITSDISNIILKIFIWLFLLLIVVIANSSLPVRKFKGNSINNFMNDYQINSKIYKPKDSSSFFIKQLLIQMGQLPKQTILIIITLCICILTVVFSFFLQKESEGIWDAEQDYYIDAQEIFAFENIKNLSVLVNEGQTFSLDDVDSLEHTKGIDSIEKNPFMVDVHPLINEDNITYSLKSWINQNGSLNHLYRNNIIIPNIGYQIIDESEFNKVYSNGNFEQFKGKVILAFPNLENKDDNRLVGEALEFVKMYRSQEMLKTKEWNFEIFDVVNKSKVSKYSDLYLNNDNEITIFLDKDTAIESGIFTGYKDLTVYLEEDVEEEEEKEIEKKIYEMVAPIPGSLYQKTSLTKIEDTRISVYVGYLGEFSFFISLFLSSVSMVSILLSKYLIKKRIWGIYMSLGMRKNMIFKLISFEIYIYFFISVICSTIIFFLFMNIFNHIYPTSFYFVYYIYSLSITLAFTFIGVIILSLIINNRSILSLLRLRE
ncbi:MAG: FtsX-like permease family protein [Bacillaceae bacterium]